MLKRSHSFHLLVVAVIASVFLVSSNKSDAKQQTWGLCIGVSDYEDDDIPDLKWASKDAIEFCTTFLKHRLKLPEEHYQILFESSAKKQEIEKLLGWLSIKAKAEDQVFIFYSGHGGKTSPIVPYDANPNDKQTFLGSDIIQKALDKIDAHETIFIIDACYSGRLARAGSKALNEKGLTEGLSKSLIDEVAQTEEEAQKKVSSNVTRVIMTSSDEDQKSVGLPNKKNGLFTYYLMNTLIQHPGEADTKPHDGKLSLAEVYQDVYKAVTENRLKKADFIITEDTLKQLKSEEVPREVLKKLEMHFKDEKITGLEEFLKRLEKTAIGKGNLRDYKELILKYTKISVQTPRISNDEKAQQIIVFIINELEELPAPDIADSNFDIGQIIMEDADREFIESDPMGMYSIKKDETVTIQVEFFNPDKHNLEVAWTARYGRISPFSRKISPHMTENSYIAKKSGHDYVIFKILDKDTGEWFVESLIIRIKEE